MKNIANERNICLSWDETLKWLELIGITPVPAMYDGIFDEKIIRNLWNDKDWDNSEGYVMRVADAIEYGEFRHKVAKFVRNGHIQTIKHWMHGQPIEPNKLLADTPAAHVS